MLSLIQISKSDFFGFNQGAGDHQMVFASMKQGHSCCHQRFRVVNLMQKAKVVLKDHVLIELVIMNVV